MDEDKLFDVVLHDLLENPRGGHLSEILPTHGVHFDEREREKLFHALKAEDLVKEAKRIISADRRIVLTAFGNRIARLEGAWSAYALSMRESATSAAGHPRRDAGRETVHRLKDWGQGQAASERLMARLLSSVGYEGLMPSRPTGGRDGGKDAICFKEGRKYVAHSWFAKPDRSFSAVKKKFLDDAKGIAANGAGGLVFFTNQDLSPQWIEKLKLELANDVLVDFFPLERIALLLDRPANYGLRREFLQIAMSQEEGMAFHRSTGSLASTSVAIDAVILAEQSLEGLDAGVLMYQLLQRCESCSFRFKVRVMGAEPIDSAMDDSHEPDSYYSSMFFRMVNVKCPKCNSLEDVSVFQRFSMPRAGVSIFA